VDHLVPSTSENATPKSCHERLLAACNSEFAGSFSLTPNFSWVLMYHLVGRNRFNGNNIDYYRFNGFAASWMW